MYGAISKTTIASLICLTTCLVTTGASAQSDLEASVVLVELNLRDAANGKTTEYVRGIENRLREMKTLSVLGRDDALRQLKKALGRSAGDVSVDQLDGAKAKLAQGEELAFRKPSRAIPVLAEAKAAYDALGDSVVGNTEVRADHFKTLILLARCQLFSGDEAQARTTMQSLLRTFGDEFTVTSEKYHPKLVDLYTSVLEKEASKRTGALVVRTRPSGCEVFINGRRMTDESPAAYTGLYAGEVSVLARKGRSTSIARNLTIPSGGQVEIDIDLAYESSLLTHDGQFGLGFDTEAEAQKHLINYSEAIGEALKVDYVILAGVIQREGQPLLASWKIDVKRRAIVKQRALTVKPNVISHRRIEEMSVYLGAVQLTASASDSGLKPWYTNWVGWTLVGTAVALGAGAGAVGQQYGTYRDEAQLAYPNGLTEAEKEAEYQSRIRAKNSAENLEVPLYVLSGLAGASLIAGIVVFAVMDVEADDTSSSMFRFGRDIVATPTLLPGGAGVSTQFKF